MSTFEANNFAFFFSWNSYNQNIIKHTINRELADIKTLVIIESFMQSNIVCCDSLSYNYL